MAGDLLTASADNLFQQLAWPSPEDEQWRRTDLSRLLPKGALEAAAGASAANRRSAPPEAVPAEAVPDPAGRPEPASDPLFPPNPAARIITENGRPVSLTLSEKARRSGLSVEWASFDALPPALEQAGREALQAAPDRIAAWHWRDMPGTLIIRLPRNIPMEAPIVIQEHFAPAAETAPAADTPPGALPAPFSAPHLHIEAAESSQLTVLWSFDQAAPAPSPAASNARSAAAAAAVPSVAKAPADPTPMVNAGLTAQCAQNARVNIVLRQNLGPKDVFFINGSLTVQRDGALHFFESHTGGALVKTLNRAVLAGEGADARMSGAYAARPGRHLDIGTLQSHQSPQATSDALYKGAVRPGGRSIFQGLIEVAPKAAKTDAYLTNNNLVLGSGARADSLPQLNILTDDVKCSHGSTTGKLNESQLFYLRSRGYSPEEAVNELTRAFLVEVTDRAPAAFTDLINADLDTALSEGSDSWHDG